MVIIQTIKDLTPDINEILKYLYEYNPSLEF